MVTDRLNEWVPEPGDKIVRKDEGKFSSGKRKATVSRVGECAGSTVVWMEETNTWVPLSSVRPYLKSDKVRSDGGSTDYYKLPAGATELADLIEYKKMDFNVGNIFKACYRLGEKEGNDLLYDINKIIYFAERIKKQIEKAR